MDPLKDWYEYLDRVSRPVRRRRGEESEPEPAWRPWMEEQDDAKIEGAVSPDQVPDLFPAAEDPGLGNTCQPASRAFEDPTLHDELQPIPEHQVPELSAPAFDVEKPAFLKGPRPTPSPLGGIETPTSSEGTGGETPPPASRRRLEAGSKGGVALGALEWPAEPVNGNGRLLAGHRPGHGDEAGGSGPESRARRGRDYRALLVEPPMPEASSEGALLRAQEAREALVRRLLQSVDPERLQQLADPVLTLEETALLLGVCSATVRRYTNSGRLAHHRTAGNQRRFRLSDVLVFMEKRGVEADSPAPSQEDETREGEGREN